MYNWPEVVRVIKISRLGHRRRPPREKCAAGGLPPFLPGAEWAKAHGSVSGHRRASLGVARCDHRVNQPVGFCLVGCEKVVALH